MGILGERLRDLREVQGLSRYELARRAGVDQAYVARIEAGHSSRPGHTTLTNLAAALNVAIPELTGESEPALLTTSAAFAVAHRWAALVPALDHLDVEDLLRTLARVSAEARTDIVEYARFRAMREQQRTDTPRVYPNPSHGSTARILGGDGETRPLTGQLRERVADET